MSEAGDIIRSGAADKAADLLHMLAGPAAEQIGLWLGDIAWKYRAKNLIKIVEKTGRMLAGVSRESLYRALSAEGNPEFATVLRVMQALGLQLTAVPIQLRKSA